MPPIIFTHAGESFMLVAAAGYLRHSRHSKTDTEYAVDLSTGDLRQFTLEQLRLAGLSMLSDRDFVLGKERKWTVLRKPSYFLRRGDTVTLVKGLVRNLEFQKGDEIFTDYPLTGITSLTTGVNPSLAVVCVEAIQMYHNKYRTLMRPRLAVINQLNAKVKSKYDENDRTPEQFSPLHILGDYQ